MFLAGFACFVLLFEPGPREVAERMGKNCSHAQGGPSEQCTILDAVELLFIGPSLILIGGLALLLLRPPGKGPLRIDLSGR